MGKKAEIEDLDLPLNKDLFMRKLLRELTGTLQDVVGMEAAAGYINTVGSLVGEWIEEQYRQGLEVSNLNAKQVARVLIDLKKRIGGDFYIIAMDDEKIVIGNRKCPFGELAHDRESLCMMTSNVFGRITADNLGYARVDLQETIARKNKECRIVVHLNPDRNADATEREYYRTSRTAD